MSTKILKRKVLAGAASFVVMFSLLSASHAHANSSLRSEMNKMFGSMSNATTPGAYESTRRGGITGGSLVVRNKIMNTNIVGFQPPSFNGGCGGIDMFGGSFSFINKEQFIQLLRSIASNASSYAFYLALEAMAPSVRATMDNIQEKIQQFNQFFGNSCQLAQGIRTDPAAAFEKAREVTAGLGKSIQEGAGDIFETFTGTSGSAPTEGISLATKNKVSGNVVWKSLKEKGVASWFTYGGDNLNMAIMTITGTVIIGPDAPAPDGQGNSPEITTIPGNGISLKDMIDGGDVFVLSCGSDTEHCLNPDPKKMTSAELVGFRRMVMDMLLGNGSDPGIISKLRQGVEPSPREKAFIANLPASMGSMIHTVVRVSENVTRSFVEESSEPLAREMAYELLKAFSDAAIAALAAERDNPYADQAREQIEKARAEFMMEHQTLVASGGKLSEVMRNYNQILQAAARNGVTSEFSIAPTPSSNN